MWTRKDRFLGSHLGLIAVFPWAVIRGLEELGSEIGSGARVLGGFVALAVFFAYLRWLWSRLERLAQLEREQLRQAYTGVYRVLGAPRDTDCIRWVEGVTVQVGDVAWERPPVRKNGLIYLEGLTEDWGRLWMAGFEPSKVEFVCSKPASQYDWRDFEYAGVKPVACYHWPFAKPADPCPFAVQAPKDLKLQFPEP